MIGRAKVLVCRLPRHLTKGASGLGLGFLPPTGCQQVTAGCRYLLASASDSRRQLQNGRCRESDFLYSANRCAAAKDTRTWCDRRGPVPHLHYDGHTHVAVLSVSASRTEGLGWLRLRSAHHLPNAAARLIAAIKLTTPRHPQLQAPAPPSSLSSLAAARLICMSPSPP